MRFDNSTNKTSEVRETNIQRTYDRKIVCKHKFAMEARGPFYENGLTLIQA